MHAADALLATRFSVIERGFAGLASVQAKYAKALEELSRAAGKEESAVAVQAGKERAHEKARRAFEKREIQLKDLSDAVTALLRGRDIGQWRADLDALKERERLLVQTGEMAARMDRASTALEGLNAARAQSAARLAAIQNEVKACGDQKNLLDKEIAALETQVSLLSRIRDLEEERKRLEDGRPCPLCGATDHPYAQGNLPVLEAAEADLQERKDRFRAVSGRLGELEAGLVRTEAEIRHAEKEMAEKKAAWDADREQCSAALSRLNLEASPSERSGRIREALEEVRARIAEAAKIVALAEEKGQQEKSVQAAREEARRAMENAGKVLQDARHCLDTARLEHGRLKKECVGLAAEMEKTRAAVLADLRPLGVGDIPPDGFGELVKDLTRRKDRWQTKEAEKTALEKLAGDLKAAIEMHRALLGKLEEDLALRRRDRDGLKGEHESLAASRRELFGEKNAGEEEKRLAAVVDLAAAKLEKAREDQGLIEKEIGTLKERIASLLGRTAERAAELNRTERHLLARVQGAGFADEADYLCARLSDEERERLAAREQNLLKEKTELEARRRDRAEALAAEGEKKLTDLAAETLAEGIRAGEVELQGLRLEIGGLLKGLADNEARKGSQAERLRAIGLQQRECARWEELHALIGSADGKKFRNFAQGLTFEMMTAHANRRLQEMTDRYLLIRDTEQPLELNVIDNYQAGEIRSTKNLSGGESFIVSLALALGLSQMASRNVRVDSLFLDEGFGTLDEDALETALETLAGLRQDGKLIGVISHVAALKERIATRIQVIPESGGRSRLSGPGCRRL
jgi:exonuclease SbcC